MESLSPMGKAAPQHLKVSPQRLAAEIRFASSLNSLFSILRVSVSILCKLVPRLSVSNVILCFLDWSCVANRLFVPVGVDSWLVLSSWPTRVLTLSAYMSSNYVPSWRCSWPESTKLGLRKRRFQYGYDVSKIKRKIFLTMPQQN